LRNPTGGNPHTLLIKDDSVGGTTAQNCVVYYKGNFPALPFNTPISTPYGPAIFTSPAAGIHALQSVGIANATFGPCNAAGLYALQSFGFSTVGPDGSGLLGQNENLSGNALQYTPQMSISLTAQYTQPLRQDYNLVAIASVHWQSHMWQRIWQDGADYIRPEYVVDASLQLNSPDGLWFAQAYVKNLTNQNNITGGYLGAPASGLFTNVFYGDPRTYGVELGINFQ
jgi:outer membrane receptor protein involved in Fe transport